MDSEYGTPFSKSVLTGVFCGIATTLICFLYELVYREKTGYSLSDLINVSSLIFIVNLIFLALGTIYYFFIRLLPKGDIWYIVVFALLTAFTVMRSMQAHRTDDEVLNAQFRHLLTGIVLIIGIVGSLGIPYLFHSKKFAEHVI